MASLTLNAGHVVLVDDADLGVIDGYRWFAGRVGRTNVYAMARDENGKTTYMHRLILPDAAIVDHINHDGLDNRRCNLRPCPRNGLNVANGRFPVGRAGYRGVTPAGRRFRAQIKAEGKQMYLGLFVTPEEAALAYDEAARNFFGEFASLNFP